MLIQFGTVMVCSQHMATRANAQGQTEFLVSVGFTLFRVNEAATGGVEAFPNQVGRVTAMTVVPSGVRVTGFSTGDVIALEPGVEGRIWRIDNARAGVPALVDAGSLPKGVGGTDIVIAHERLFIISNSASLVELDTTTFGQVGSPVVLLGSEVTTGGLTFDGANRWFLLDGVSNRMVQFADPPTPFNWIVLGPSGVDFDSSDLEILGGQIWSAFRSPGNSAGRLRIGTFNSTTGAFQEHWDVVAVPQSQNVNIGLAVFPTCSCRDFGDLDCDGSVSLFDVATQFVHFGTKSSASHCDGDLDWDHDVDLADFALLVAGFTVNCP